MHTFAWGLPPALSVAARARGTSMWRTGAIQLLLALAACGDGGVEEPCDGGACDPDPPVECAPAQVCGDACCAAGSTCDRGTCVSGSTCLYVPGPGEFEAPVKAWWWPWEDATGTVPRAIELPAFRQVMSTPAVARLVPGDAVPTVVFPSFRSGGTPNVEGVLRAVRGDDGSPVWTVTDPSLRVNGVSSVALGDLDGDGRVEIVAGAWDGGANEAGLLAFRSDGTFLWRQSGSFVGWGGPALADLDGDGHAEVILGNTVLEGSSGRVLCAGQFLNSGDNGVGPLSVVADLDGDGRPEIIAGNQTFSTAVDPNGQWTCPRFWPRNLRDNAGKTLRDGFPAVADVFDDPAIRSSVNAPEIAVVSHGSVRVHDWTGGLLMNPVLLPGGGLGGPPTIADFDGDGRAEIGVAALHSYTVFKPGRPGNILWSVATQDESSSTTGSSVFDFDGNGRAEVVYADECFVHVYDGATGLEVFRAPNTSCTAYEMPVVADVDGDGAAELLVGANDECSITCPYGTHAQARLSGLAVYKSPSDGWVASRPIWNQHGYHVVNVTDDGAIPAHEERGWGAGTRNSFRQNYQGEGVFAAPNLVVTGTRLEGDACPLSLTLVAELANLGSRAVRAGLPVAFYEDRAGARTLLGVVTVPGPLRPGDRAEVRLEWPGPPRLQSVPVVVIVDDDGTGLLPKGRHKECDETDNARAIGQVRCREAG